MLLLPRISSGEYLAPNHNRLLILITYRNDYATFQEIKTKTITVPGNKGDSKKAKLFITLKKSPNFQENMDKFNKIREDNEALAAAKKTEETKQWV